MLSNCNLLKKLRFICISVNLSDVIEFKQILSKGYLVIWLFLHRQIVFLQRLRDRKPQF